MSSVCLNGVGAEYARGTPPFRRPPSVTHAGSHEVRARATRWWLLVWDGDELRERLSCGGELVNLVLWHLCEVRARVRCLMTCRPYGCHPAADPPGVDPPDQGRTPLQKEGFP